MTDIEKFPSLKTDIVFEATGSNISGIAYDGKHLWQSDAQSDILFKTDMENGKALHSIPCSNTCSDLSSDGEHLWQIVKTPRWIRCLNPQNGSILSELKIEPADCHPSGICVDGNYFWLALSDKGLLQKRSLSNGLVVKQFKVTKQIAGICLAKSKIWFVDKTGYLICIDPQSGNEECRYPLTGMPISLTWDGKQFWYLDCLTKTIRSITLPA